MTSVSQSVQSFSCVWLFATPWIAACQASLSITNSRSSPKLMSIELVMPSSHLILCHPLLFLPPFPPSIGVFSNESTLHMRWPKYWSFSFSISPSNEYPGLIFFRMDWLDLLAVQGTLKNLLQHHSSKASILFFFLTLQYCIGFAIYQHESATGIHVFPILNPPPSNSSVLSFQEPIIIQGQTFFSIRDDRKFVLIITLNIRKTNHMNLLIHLSVSGKADGSF